MYFTPGLMISASPAPSWRRSADPSDYSADPLTRGGLMTAMAVRRLLVVGAILALPAAGFAQEATLSGTVTDSTGGVLPGVTITAVHQATGNTFEGVTDERGGYRIAARAGVFRMTASLPGFGTTTRAGLELLVGQQAVLNLQLSPSAVQESVTVTGRDHLVEAGWERRHAADAGTARERPRLAGAVRAGARHARQRHRPRADDR
jgi:hypothetical protein